MPHSFDIIRKLSTRDTNLVWFETAWKLLIIEPFSQWKLNKIEIWKLYWNLEVFLMLLESPSSELFNRVYFTIFSAKVWKILIFVWTLLLEIQNKLQKINWVRKEKISWSPECVHTWGQQAQATLVVNGMLVWSLDLSRSFQICLPNLQPNQTRR